MPGESLEPMSLACLILLAPLPFCLKHEPSLSLAFIQLDPIVH